MNGPLSGVSVTTESSLPWPHHRSLFFGCDKVNGCNYWQEGNEEGQIVSRGASIANAGPDRVEIADACDWRSPGGEPRSDRQAGDPHRGTVPVPASHPVRVTLVAQTDVRIERTNHSLFAARMASELSAEKGGVLRNSAGALGEKGTFGVAAPWCDVSGTRFGLREGLAIFDSPRNRFYPPKWFTRDYGFFSPPRSTGSTTRAFDSLPARSSRSSTRSSSTAATRPKRGSPRSSRRGRRSARPRPGAPQPHEAGLVLEEEAPTVSPEARIRVA